jgi:hypothetical protein
MPHKRFTIFDDYVPAGSGAVYTSDRWNAVLGAFDEIAVHAIIDDVSGATGTFDCWIETSGDARNWLQRNDLTQATPAPHGVGTGDLFSSALTSTSVSSLMYSDAAMGITKFGTGRVGPLLGFVRLAVLVGTVGAHVRLHYCGRGHAG